MDLDIAPSWPPPGRWRLGLVIGAVVSGILVFLMYVGAGMVVPELASLSPAYPAFGLPLLLMVVNTISRFAASRRPRIVRIPDAELTAVMKMIDSAAQTNDKGLVNRAREYLALHLKLSRVDAGSAVGKLLRRDYPKLADRLGYLD